MRKLLGFAVLAGALTLASCDSDLTVPDFNNPSIEDLQTNPTVSSISAAATGLLIGARNNIGDGNDYVSLLGILGRESYNMDSADPRFFTEMLVGPLDAGSPAFGANLWGARYANIRNANIVLNAVGEVAGFSEAEKEAIRGYAKTIQALDFLLVINTRDTNGAPIDVDRGVNEEPAPIESKEAVFAHINQLLDEAVGHLQQGGGSFPFPLGSGFSGFDTPSTFIQFNRAIKARVTAYQENYQATLQALQASFLDPSAPLSAGSFHVFGSGSGDQRNQLTDDNIIRAHPSLVENAELQPDGSRDQRSLDKIEEVTAKTVQGVTTPYAFTLYQSQNDPIPIIRIEELLLLRAEARWFTGDRDGALADLNLVRTSSGGLAPIAMPSSDAEFVTALLYERRMSLMFEGGHRWIDARRFGRIDELPLDLSSHSKPTAFPIPEAEQLARQ